MGNFFEFQLESCVRGNGEWVIADAVFGANFQPGEERFDLGNQPFLFDAELEGVGRCSGKGKKKRPYQVWKDRCMKLKTKVVRVVQ